LLLVEVTTGTYRRYINSVIVFIDLILVKNSCDK